MIKLLIACLSIPLFSLATLAQSNKEITLNQKNVRDLILKQSPKALEVQLRYQQMSLEPTQALSAYDWRLSLESGLERDKSALLSTTASSVNYQYDRVKTSASLQKPFTTGTTLGLQISRLTQKVDYTGTPTITPLKEQTYDTAEISLEQSLLGNFFGTADRGNVNAAQLNYEANSILRSNDLEDVVLQGIQQFWNTYVAQESYKESVNSRDRYKKLVDAIKKKTTLGYSNPGDLPQVQAEFEAREQKVSTAKYDSLKQLENFVTFLGLESGTKINFEIPKELPPVPRLNEIKPENLRAVRAQKLRVAAAEESLRAANSLTYPTLNFVGSYATSGVDTTQSGSYNDLTSGNHPKYYAGLKLQYNFGSGIQGETLTSKTLAKDLQNSVLNRQLQESTNGEAQSRLLVQTQYDNALSSQRQRDFREKASQELNKSYNQGRTDISILITALNNYFNAEVQYIQALGNYSTALSEWQASRDELIPDESGKP